MTKKYLSQGVVLDTKGKDGVQNFDLENYVVSVLNKTETCCVRNIVGNSITLTESIISPGGVIAINQTGMLTYSLVATFIPSGGIQTSILSGTISLTGYSTIIETGATQSDYNLPNGYCLGQLKKISLVVDGGGNAVITGVNTVFNTITMQDAGDYVVLLWTIVGSNTLWTVIENSGSTVA